MRLVILETPYAATNNRTVEDNVAYSRRCIHDCLARGEAPIASHLLYTQDGILDDNNSEQRELGIAAGHAWYRVAEACVAYTDYGISKGMAKGILEAVHNKVPLEYRKLISGTLDHGAHS